jgi:hypothetical protein
VRRLRIRGIGNSMVVKVKVEVKEPARLPKLVEGMRKVVRGGGGEGEVGCGGDWGDDDESGYGGKDQLNCEIVRRLPARDNPLPSITHLQINHHQKLIPNLHDSLT